MIIGLSTRVVENAISISLVDADRRRWGFECSSGLIVDFVGLDMGFSVAANACWRPWMYSWDIWQYRTSSIDDEIITSRQFLIEYESDPLYFNGEVLVEIYVATCKWDLKCEMFPV